MVMWRCLIAAVGAALARSDAQERSLQKFDAFISALQKGDVSFLNDVEAVRDFLDAGWDVNERTRVRNQTLLHIAAKHGDPKVVQFLVGRGAHVNIQESDGVTPLMVACMENRTEIVKALLDVSADPTIARKDGLTPLHAASSGGNVKMIDMLVDSEHGANVDAQIPFASNRFAGYTPLHVAVKLAHKDVITALTKHGASWDLKDAKGVSPAVLGAANGMSRDQFAHSTRSDARRDGHLQEKMEAVFSALDKGDFSFLNDVEAVRDFLDSRRTEKELATSMLHTTAKHGDPKVIQLLVEYGARVDVQDFQGATPLLVASRENRTEVVKILLNSSADPTIAREDGVTPLHMAANLGNVEIIDMLAKKGAKINAQLPEDATNHGASPLSYAVMMKHKDAVAALTKHGADWYLKDAGGVSPADVGAKNGMSPDKFEHLAGARADGTSTTRKPYLNKEEWYEQTLHWASGTPGHTDFMRKALDEGADPNSRAENGETPLYAAARRGGVDAVKVLLEYGAKPDLAESEQDVTPLMAAIASADYDVVSLLLTSGRANPNLAGKTGTTPMHLAAGLESHVDADWNLPKIVEVLVKHGANVNPQIPDGRFAGQTPLHFALGMKFEGVIEALTKHGANWALKDARGVSPTGMDTRQNPLDNAEKLSLRKFLFSSIKVLEDNDLHMISADGDVVAMRRLLDQGWDPNERTDVGQLPLHYAAGTGKVEAVELLLEYGADVNLGDYTGGHTPLHAAVSAEQEEVTKVLLASGADPNKAANGATPLHMTAMMNSTVIANIIYTLAEHGVDVDAKVTASAPNRFSSLPPRWDNRGLRGPAELVGHTALHVAVDNRHTETVAALTLVGADWSLKDPTGKTPASKMGMSRREFLEAFHEAKGSRSSDYTTPTAVVIALIAIALTVAYGRKYREWSAARAESELLRGEEAAAPKPKPQRGAKKPAKRREAPRARRRQAPRARESAPEANTPEPVVAAPEPKLAPAPTRAEPSRSAPVAPPTPPRAEPPPPEPAPTRTEPPRPAPVAAPPPRAETPPPKPVPECKTEEPESKREEPEALVVPRGYETVAHILEAHGESSKLATFEEQLINDETLPFLEASDLLELGVSPMAILAIVEVSSAAREKSKKLDAEDVLHDVATHQSVLEKELAEHRAEIARLRMNRRGEVPDHMCCPIMMEVMRDPVMAADGHTYEKVAIEQWFLKARTSPTTNEPLASLALLPNHAIRCAIAEEMERRRS